MNPFAKENTIIIWGLVTQDAWFKRFENGKCKTNFSIKYGFELYGDGKKKSNFIDIEAWNELAEYSSGLEKGDKVLILGDYTRDEYKTQKKGEDVYKIVADMVIVQNLGFAQTPTYEPVVHENPKEQHGFVESENAFEDMDEEAGELPF